MIHTPDGGRSLGPLTQEGLELIIAATEPENGIERERAKELLVSEAFSTDDAEWTIQLLLDHGYCYEVDNVLFVTDRDILD